MAAWDRTVDIVVVGSGSSGCSAALAAHEHGFETVLLEKSDLLGGGTTYSSGGIWIPANHLAREAGIDDSLETGATYLRFLGGGYQVEDSVRAYIENGPAILKYFTDLGIPLQVARNVPDIYFGRAPGAVKEGRMIEVQLFPAQSLGAWRERVRVSPFTYVRATFDEALRWGGRGSYAGWDMDEQERRRREDWRALGAGLVAAFVKALLDRGIEIRTSAPARRLIAEDGRITGILAELDGVEQRIGVRDGVILATGGYEGNPELVANFEDLQKMRNMFTPEITGDALIMGSEIGAKLRVIPRQLTIFMGYDVPARDGQPAQFRNAGTSEIPQAHSIIVNRFGKRFGDEAFFQKFQNGLRAFDVETHTYPNMPCYWIFDAQYASKFSFSALPIGEIPDFVKRADTAQGLAAQLGIDPAGFAAELERFNGFVREGVDRDFGRGGEAWSRNYSGDLTNRNPNLGTIERAPFYGILLEPSGMSSAGLLTNALGQVVNVRDVPIGGLYALANCAAGIEYGVGYQAGLSLGKGMIFGYLAIKHMEAQRTGAAA